MRRVGLGLVLTAVVAAVLALVFGAGAFLPAATFGVLATGIQYLAGHLLRPVLGAPFPVLVRRWAIGMGLRLAGVVLIAVAIAADRRIFEPLPTALGYLGVLIPLLFAETRFLR